MNATETLRTLSTEELIAVHQRAAAEFKARPRTKAEAVAKAVYLAASAEIVLRLAA